MAITLTTVKCPDCGASLPIEEGREKIFCSFCGAQVQITNENEHIYRHIDEAEVKQAETDRLIRLKELEIEESRRKQGDSLKNLLTKIWIGSIFVVAIICLAVWISDDELGGLAAFNCLFYIGGPVVGGGAYLIFKVIPDRESEKMVRESGGIKFPKYLEPFDEKNYEEIENALTRVGFSNITCINLHDVTLGILQKPGIIEDIKIDNEIITEGGKYYMPNTPITITYHGR